MGYELEAQAGPVHAATTAYLLPATASPSALPHHNPKGPANCPATPTMKTVLASRSIEIPDGGTFLPVPWPSSELENRRSRRRPGPNSKNANGGRSLGSPPRARGMASWPDRARVCNHFGSSGPGPGPQPHFQCSLVSIMLKKMFTILIITLITCFIIFIEQM